MMKITLLILISALLVGCSNSSEEKIPAEYQNVKLTYDNGAEWDVPEGMQVFMDSSILLVKQNNGTDITSDLIRQKDSFVSNCTMPGEGHDVLHAWLMPYLDLLERLENANSSKERDIVLEDIRYAHELFEEYFK